MRRTASLLVPLLLLASTTFAGWSSSGPTGGAMNAVVVAPSDSNVIWVANAAGVYRSTDGGATWNNVSGPTADVVYLAVHPTDSNKAWAWSQSAGVYRTADGGATWTLSPELAGTVAPTGFFVDPGAPDTLYATANCHDAGFDLVFLKGWGLHQSTDGGATWHSLLFPCVAEASIDPFSPWRLFLTAVTGERAESYDRAKTFQGTREDRPSRAVLFDPRYPYTHYGIASFSSYYGAFVVSQDGGFTWSTVSTKLPSLPRALTIDPERGRLFLGTTAGMFRSGNGGRVWAGTQLPEAVVNALEFARATDKVLAATNLGLFEVDNHGLGRARRIDLGEISANVIAFDVDPGDGKFLYAVTDDARVFRSTNGGASWQQLAFEDDVAIDHIAVGADGTVYASSIRQHTLYRRGRKDETWTAVRDGVFTNILVADPKNPGTLFLRGCCGFERSRDFGQTWQVVLSGLGNVLAISANDPQTVYAVLDDRIFRTADGGAIWQQIGRAPTLGLFPAPSNNQVVYRIGEIGNVRQLDRSDDSGGFWQPLPLPGGLAPATLAVDPHDANSVWAAADPAYYTPGLFRSTNGGRSWVEVKGPFGTSISATAIRFDPSGSVVHFALPNHGVWEMPLN